MSELRQKILDSFIDEVSLNGKAPASVYAFCKAHSFSEEEVYQYFSTFASMEKAVWSDLFTQVITVVEGDPVFEEYNTREKYLAYCFTLVEHLKKHLSFYRASSNERTLKNALHHPSIKSQKTAQTFFESLVQMGINSEEIKTPGLLQKPVSKLFQLHNMFVINYFLKDESEGFKETDQAIEKSARLLFDAIENSLLDSAIDFTKFMGKSVFA